MKFFNVHSIRTKILLMTACTVLVFILVSMLSGIIVIRKIGNDSANRLLLLLCESGEKNPDHYFESVEQSVEMVSAYVESDLNGHDKGDIYLKEAAAIICEVFTHSPVFRIGGDEFAAILLDRDFVNREELLREFDEVCKGKRRSANEKWEQVDVARGMAVFDPAEDFSVSDVVRRADRSMYKNKWMRKEMICSSQESDNE